MIVVLTLVYVAVLALLIKLKKSVRSILHTSRSRLILPKPLSSHSGRRASAVLISGQ